MARSTDQTPVTCKTKMAADGTIMTRSRSRLNGLANSTFNSPRPTPQFFPDGCTFSTKKERGTPKNSLPPRPPIKSCPPVSRIFPHRPDKRPHVVSFKESTDQSFLSMSYNTSSKQTYFQQGFDVIEMLGSGSFGEVFKVRSKKDGRFYAVKRSHDKFRGEYDRKRKVEEVAKYESLPPHKNCVHFYHAWEERQKLFIQMELCPLSLSQLAEQNHTFAEQLIWKYLVDLLMAVKHLHEHNLIHMDIKPENIFISHLSVCKLGDFGLVIDLTKKVDLHDAQEGDPKYLAPELLEGKFGKPADVFSLGMTILELASDLDLPRGGEGWHQLREGHVPEEFLVGRSFDMKYVIRQMLHSCPTTRPTAVQLLAFPCVRKVWKQRHRDYMVKSAIAQGKVYLAYVVSFIMLIGWLLMYPFKRLHHRATNVNKCAAQVQPIPSIASSSSVAACTTSNTQSTTSVFDTSISDDELLYNYDIVASNSACAPLYIDTSSDNESFCKPLPRGAYTTPGVRGTNRHRPHSPFSSSPVSVSARKKWASSQSEMESSFEEEHQERCVTPSMSYHGDGGDTEIKAGIEPKNLLDMFEAASDEEGTNGDNPLCTK